MSSYDTHVRHVGIAACLGLVSEANNYDLYRLSLQMSSSQEPLWHSIESWLVLYGILNIGLFYFYYPYVTG